jgi:transposase
VPALQPYLIEPLWQQFQALLPRRETNHPLGCHRPRVPDRVVFAKLLEVLVFGCAYWRIADESCSESTLRRRRDEWIAHGVMERLREISPEASMTDYSSVLSSPTWWPWTAASPRPLAAARRRGGAPWIGGKGRRTLNGGGRRRHSAWDQSHPGQPSRLAASGRDPGRRGRGARGTDREDERPPRPRLRLAGDPRKAARARVARRDLREGQARPDERHEEGWVVEIV